MKFLISVVSFVVTLFLAEHLIRVIHPAPQVFRFLLGGQESAYQLSTNPILGYELKANVRSATPDCHNTFDYTNEFGQRDKERSLAASPSKRRIIMLGDSVVAGHGLCSMDKTISQQLERTLGADTFEVLNFGVGGYCTRGEVELLKTKGLQFHPDEVVVLFVNNDYTNSNGAIVSQIRSQRPPLLEWAFRKSHLVRWFCLHNNTAGFRDDFDPQQRTVANQNALGQSNIGDGVELLAKLAREHNFKPRIVLWPYFTDRGIHEPRPLKDIHDEAPLLVETVAQQYGIETHRLVPFFVEDFRELQVSHLSNRAKKPSPRWVYTIGDGTHPSERGAQTAARAIAGILAK